MLSQKQHEEQKRAGRSFFILSNQGRQAKPQAVRKMIKVKNLLDQLHATSQSNGPRNPNSGKDAQKCCFCQVKEFDLVQNLVVFY